MFDYCHLDSEHADGLLFHPNFIFYMKYFNIDAHVHVYIFYIVATIFFRKISDAQKNPHKLLF